MRSRVASIPLIAGRPVLDLVNTVSWRGTPERAEDHLQQSDHCLTWALRTGVISEIEADVLRRQLDERSAAAARLTNGLRRLRDVVAGVIQEPSPGSLAHSRQVILEARRHSHLVRSERADDLSCSWRVTELDEHTLARRLALDLDDFLQEPGGRVGVCADPACRWVFLDTSRSRNRRWCSSADCGNRHRVARHQRRRQAT